MNPLSQFQITNHWRWLVPAFWLASASLSPAQTATPSPSAAATPGQKLPSGLVKGILEEDANLDLHAAIKSYQSVLSQFEEQRPNVANAIFRLGECYRKLGQTNEANAQYERVLREFSDQIRLVELSRAYLGSTNPALATAAAVGAATPFDIVADGQALHPATQKEHDELIRIIALVKDSPDLVNSHADNGDFLLANAASLDQLSVAEYLLAHGADVNASGRGSHPAALVNAAGRGHKTMTQLLLAHGADVNALDSYGYNALLSAAGSGFKAVVDVLLEHGAKVNIKNKSGLTPLHVSLNFIAVTELLLAHGAEVNAKDAGGMTPLVRAAWLDGSQPSEATVAAAKLLLKAHADPNISENHGWTALHYASRGGQIAMVELLLNYHAEIDPRENYGRTPLWIAFLDRREFDTDLGQLSFDQSQNLLHLWWERKETVEILLKNHAKIDAKDKLGRTALVVSALHLNREEVEFLLAHGADVNAKDTNGWTALIHLATGQGPGSPGIIPPANDIGELLLANGAMIDAKDTSGQTALHQDVRWDRPEWARWLLDHKADVNAKDILGQTPLIVAIATGHWSMVNTLLERRANENIADNLGRTPLHYSVSMPPTDGLGLNPAVAALIAHGADVNAKDVAGRTPLMAAISAAQWVMVKPLLDHQANVNLTDENGLSPLDYLLATDPTPVTPNVLGLLLSYKADVNAKDNEGRTPLLFAIAKVNTRNVEVLLDAGADAKVKDNSGHTALQVLDNTFATGKGRLLEEPARSSIRANLAQILLNHGAIAPTTRKASGADDGGVPPAANPARNGAPGTVFFNGEVMGKFTLLAGQPKYLSEAVLEMKPPDSANLKKVRLIRLDNSTGKSKTILVNVEEILGKKLKDKDYLLEDGDRVVISREQGSVIFYGEIKGTMPLEVGQPKYLSEAIFEMKPSEHADLKSVKLIRQEAGVATPKTFVVNVEEILSKGLKVKDIVLQDGDAIRISPKMSNF